MTTKSPVLRTLAGQWRRLIWVLFLAVIVASFLGGLGVLLEAPSDHVHKRQTTLLFTTTGNAERFADTQRFWRASSGMQFIVTGYLLVDTLLFIPFYGTGLTGLRV